MIIRLPKRTSSWYRVSEIPNCLLISESETQKSLPLESTIALWNYDSLQMPQFVTLRLPVTTN